MPPRTPRAGSGAHRVATAWQGKPCPKDRVADLISGGRVPAPTRPAPSPPGARRRSRRGRLFADQASRCRTGRMLGNTNRRPSRAPVSLDVSGRHTVHGGRAEPGAAGPDRHHAPARVSALMLPARGRVARFVARCVGSAVHGGVAIGPAERALRARSGLATIADDVTCAPLRWLERASDGFILRPERKSAVLPHPL